MTKIIAIGGKKKSGKGLAGTYLSGLILGSRQSLDDFRLNQENNDYHVDLVGKGASANVHINTIDPDVVKIYNFADRLKLICADLFGLDINKFHGTEEEKNSPTHLKWSCMPGVCTNEQFFHKAKNWEKARHGKVGRKKFGEFPEGFVCKEPGFMTHRDVLQYFGTEVCRNIFQPCWSNALLADIRRDGPEFAIITDLRFDNEFFDLKSQSAMQCLTVYLMRDIYEGNDGHASENGFSDDLSWDIKIDNRAGGPKDMCDKLIERIRETNILRPNDTD